MRLPDFVSEREKTGEGFTLYFAGSQNRKCDEYLISHQANRLHSQLNERNHIKYWVENKSEKSKLFVDSGAFTAYTKGISVNVDEYISYINSISEYLTIFAQVDTIPGQFNKPKTLEEVLAAPAKSWENYLYMRDRVKEPDKLVPIFHQGEDYKWLRNMLEWTDNDGKHIPYIGISPAIDVPGMESFLDKSFEIISESSNPNVKTHAFGMTRLQLLEIYPYYSADSTSWLMSGSMGSVYTPYGTIYVSDRRDTDKSYIKNQPQDAYNNIEAYINKLGYTMEEVRSNYVVRLLMNIQYLLDWAASFKFKGRSHKKSLF